MEKKFKEKDTIVLFDEKRGKYLLLTLKSGLVFHTHAGSVNHNDLIGKKEGEEIPTSTGKKLLLFKPRACDHMVKVKRETQIVYPKDAGWMLLFMDIFPGAQVIEMGIGSGAFTIAMAQAVGEEGAVYSFEKRKDFLENALKNVRRAGLESRVKGDILEAGKSFLIKNVDAVFLDLPEPWSAIPAAYDALKPGGVLGIIIPSVEQLKNSVSSMKENNFSFIEPVEILKRGMLVRQKEGVRPSERMVGFTGYLITGRKKI